MKFIAIPFTKYGELMTCSAFQSLESTVHMDPITMTFTMDMNGKPIDEELRELVTVGLAVPDDITWIEISEEVATGKCPTEPAELGDARKYFKDQFKVDEVDGRFFYIVGRTSTVTDVNTGKEIPTGNWKSSLDPEVFFVHVDHFGIDNLYATLPQVETEVI